MKYVAAIAICLFATTAEAGWLWGPRVVIHNYGVVAPPSVVYAPAAVVVVPRVHKERHVYRGRSEKHVVKVKY